MRKGSPALISSRSAVSARSWAMARFSIAAGRRRQTASQHSNRSHLCPRWIAQACETALGHFAALALRAVHKFCLDPRSGGGLTTKHLVGLRTLLPLDDVKFDLVSLLQTLVPIQLDRAVVHEDIRTIVPSDEAVSLRVVEPLHLAFVLGHVSVTSLRRRSGR